jgi:hypothetical protein
MAHTHGLQLLRNRQQWGWRGSQTWMRAVLTMPGDMQLTLTPRAAHSAPSVCVILTTAALDALYATCFCGCGTSTLAMLAVFIMRPRPCLSMILPSACTHSEPIKSLR